METLDLVRWTDASGERAVDSVKPAARPRSAPEPTLELPPPGTKGAVAAPLPDGEEERLLELRNLKVLDTEADPRLDRITALVREVLEVPIAVVSLVDASRQWFKSRHGLDATETGRDVAFCAHAIHEREMLVVPDTHGDPRFRTNPLVVGPPHIRAYVGVVLRGAGGQPIGTLCAIDTRRWRPTERELSILASFAEMARDELLRKETERELEAEVTRSQWYDPLTGLPNRFLLQDRLHLLASRAEAGRVVVVEVANLTTVNALHGRVAGDELLKEVAARLKGAGDDARAVGRVSARRFALWFEGDPSQDEMEGRIDGLADRLGRALEAPGGAVVRPSLRFGYSAVPRHGRSSAHLVEHAVRATRWAQRVCPGPMVVAYTRDLDVLADREFELAERLEGAIAGGRIGVAYQSQHDRWGRWKGVEVLARWTDPEWGPVSVAEWMPVAETHGWVDEVTQRVLDRVEEDAPEILRVRPGLVFSVNLSAAQLGDDRFLRQVAERIRNGLWTTCALRLEVTESAFPRMDSSVLETLRQLRARGVGLSVDDFGTGHSCLDRLRTLPISELKVDRAFVRDLERDVTCRRILQAVVGLGRALDLEITVEGVETEAQFRRLRELQVDTFQGFWFGRPMSKTELLAKHG